MSEAALTKIQNDVRNNNNKQTLNKQQTNKLN